MTNLVPIPSNDPVFQLELTTPALGGPGGVANAQAQALANQIEFLRQNPVADTSSLARNGSRSATANIPMGGFKLTGLAAGSANGDSVRFDELQLKASLSDLSANNGSSLIGTLQTGTGMVARTVLDQSYDIVSVFDAMTPAQVQDVRTNSATLDVTAAVNSAMATGRKILFPEGTYRLTGTINVPAGAFISGAGPARTIFSVVGGTFDVVSLNGNGASIEGVQIKSAAPRSGGAAVLISSASRANLVYLCKFDGQFKGIFLNADAVVTWIVGNEFVNTTSATGVTIDINGGNDTFMLENVSDNPAGAQPLAGLRITKSDAVWSTDNDFIHSGVGLRISPTANTLTWLFFNNTAFDLGTGNGIEIVPVSPAVVKGVFFNGCWSASHASNGVVVGGGTGTVDGVEMKGMKLLNNQQRGALIFPTNVNNVRFDGCSVAGNSTSSIGTQAGIDFQPNCQNFSVTGGKCGASLGFGVTQSYGILINAGTSNNYTVRGVDVSGNVTNGMVDNGTGTSKVISENISYLTRAVGISSIPIGQTSVDVTHGMPVTLAGGGLSVIPTQRRSVSGITDWWISYPNATTFRVNADATVAGAAFSFEWNSRVKGA